MPVNADRMLPVVRVGEIPSDELAERWLVEQLWCPNSVGVIGGIRSAPDMAGAGYGPLRGHGDAVLGQVRGAGAGAGLGLSGGGRVRVVGERIEGMARHRGLDIDQVAIYAITASALRLDHDRDRTRLWETARWLRPKLLVLDPLVRLHGIDENHAGAVAELLGVLSLVAKAAWHLGRFWCITRARILGMELPPVRDCVARATSMRSATRTSISGEPSST